MIKKGTDTFHLQTIKKPSILSFFPSTHSTKIKDITFFLFIS